MESLISTVCFSHKRRITVRTVLHTVIVRSIIFLYKHIIQIVLSLTMAMTADYKGI